MLNIVFTRFGFLLLTASYAPYGVKATPCAREADGGSDYFSVARVREPSPQRSLQVRYEGSSQASAGRSLLGLEELPDPNPAGSADVTSDTRAELQEFIEQLQDDEEYRDLFEGETTATLFAPLNGLPSQETLALFSKLFMNFDDIHHLKQLKSQHVGRNILMHPADVQREDQVVINSAGGAVTLHRAEDSQLYVNGDIQVLNTVVTPNAVIYLIARPIRPKVHDAPSTLEVLENMEGASVWAKLLRASNILDHYWGPVTVFAFPDSALLDPDNRPIPDCVWNGFLREENKDYLLRFLGNMIVPGVFDTASLKEGNTLLPLVGVPWEVGKPGPPDSEHDSASISIGDTSILVPDIRTEEGVLHLFAAFKPHIEKDFSNAVYWTCLDDFLRENPSFISLAFRLLDSGRPLPKLGAPPGPRPEWVARWSEKWRPYKPSVARPPARRAPA